MTERPTVDDVPSAVAIDLLDRAYEHALSNFDRGDCPIGAAIGTTDGEVLAAAANAVAPNRDMTAHAEMMAIRQLDPGVDASNLVLATTMSPCWMCAGAIQHLGVGAVVVGDDRTWVDGAVEWLRRTPTQVHVVDHSRCEELFGSWLVDHRHLWPEARLA